MENISFIVYLDS